jgi:L-threonate 2-dehydrogenase
MAENIGLLGLGIMGSAMSTNLRQAGWRVLGYDPDPLRHQEYLAAGGEDCDVADIAARCQTIITSLPTSAALRESATALARDVGPGSIVVETSTLPISVKSECRETLAEAGVTLLDCPLSGTGAQAVRRDVVVFGSGHRESLESVRPVLEGLSRSVRYVGPFGHGSLMKYVANLLVAVHNVAAAEAMALAERAGLDREKVWETIREGAGNSVIFDLRGRLMVDEQYLPATAKMSMFVKDVGIVRDYARSLQLPTPLLDGTAQLYERAVDAGLADSDAAALFTLMRSDRCG